MIHNQLHTVDLVIIGAYLIAMVMVGLVVVRKVKNMDDYYLGGRSFGPLVLMATVCATIIGGSGLMGRAGVAYSSGFKAIRKSVHFTRRNVFPVFSSRNRLNSSAVPPVRVRLSRGCA